MAAAAIVAVVLQMRSTAHFGAGLAPDSVAYVQGARHMASGLGFTQNPAGRPTDLTPITWFPPAYPMLLLGSRLVGADVIVFARYLSAALYAASMMLTVYLIRRLTRSMVFTTIAMIAVIFSTDQLEIFSQLLSEPLFIAATLTALICLANYLEKETRRRWLVATAAAVSLAAMTRYLGLLLVPFCFGVIALRRPAGRFPDGKRMTRRKLFDLVTFSVLSTAATIGWGIRSHFAGSSTGRQPAWHPATAQHLVTACQTVARWLLPLKPAISATYWPIGLGLAVLIVAGWILAVRRRPNRDAIVDVLLAFIPTYFTGLLLAISTIDAAAPTDYRLLSPIYIPAAALIAFAGASLWNDRTVRLLLSSPWPARCGFTLVLALAIATDASRTPSWIKRARKAGDGLGYASKRWHDSRALRAMHRVPTTNPVYTNAPDATYLRAGRIDRILPWKMDRSGHTLSIMYPAAIAKVRQEVLEKHGAVFFFYGILRKGAPLPEDLDRDLKGLKRVEFRNDAIVYAHPAIARKLAAALKPTTKRTRRTTITTTSAQPAAK